MSIEEKMRLILSLDGLIRRKTKGNSIELANKLNTSKSTFFRLLDCMREEFNAPVVFDKASKRYVYEEPGRVFFGFLPENVLSKEAMRKISGGHATCPENGLILNIFHSLNG